MAYFDKLRLKKTNLVNPYGGLKDVANSLGSTSKSILNREVRKDANEATATFRRTQQSNQKIRDGKTDTYRSNQQTFQNEQSGKTQKYRKDALGLAKTRETNTQNRWDKTFNKPEYKTYTGVDKDGKPVMSVFNAKDGTSKTTGAKVYQKPKELSAWQQIAFMEKEENKQRKLGFEFDKYYGDNMDNWEELTQIQQKEMRNNYIKTKGNKTPEIEANEPWFWTNSYKPKKQQPKKNLNGATIDLGL